MIRFNTDSPQETVCLDALHNLSDKPSLKSVVARDKTCFKDTYEYYTFKTPSFSSLDKAKARKDAKTIPCQGPNLDFKPHRTDANGCLTMDDPVDIEDMEQHARNSAFAPCA